MPLTPQVSDGRAMKERQVRFWGFWSWPFIRSSEVDVWCSRDDVERREGYRERGKR